MEHPDPRRGFRDGAIAIAPLLLGAIPFGMVFGATATDAGLAPAAAIAMSLTVFAGAAQLAALQLLEQGAAPAVVVLTALVVNLRFTMYSAALRPWLGDLPLRQKVPLAYLLTDQGFAVSVARFARDGGVHRPAFYLGAALPLWTTWQLSTAAGALLGAAVPPSWELEFAIPLTFLALLVGGLRGRSGVVAAIVGGAGAVLLRDLPGNLGLVTAALLGVTAGLLVGEPPAVEGEPR